MNNKKTTLQRTIQHVSSLGLQCWEPRMQTLWIVQNATALYILNKATHEWTKDKNNTE